MKKITFLVLPLLILSLLSACEKNADKIDCDSGDCLFALEEVNGKVVFMNCFSRLAVQTESPTSNEQMIYGLPDKELQGLPAETPVIFTAKFRANTLEPQFPDPNIGEESIYQIDIMEIRKKE